MLEEESFCQRCWMNFLTRNFSRQDEGPKGTRQGERRWQSKATAELWSLSQLTSENPTPRGRGALLLDVGLLVIVSKC